MLKHRRKQYQCYSVGGEYVDGEWVDSQEELFTIYATVQPINSGDIMQVIPEGRRANRSYKIYTDTKLNTVTDKKPDEILIDNERFEVFSLESWQNGLLNHYKAVVTKKM